jgi:hypothetical protein
LRIWLTMGDGTRGEEEKLLVVKVEGVFFRLWGWVGKLGREVNKEVSEDCCLPTRELYYSKKN